MAPSDIDRYLATLDEPKRSTLEEMHRVLFAEPGKEGC
jgi:hypothetical protein